ncbi:hypothetical protein AB9E35_34490, partial [Rhizobium leguminosarum]
LLRHADSAKRRVDIERIGGDAARWGLVRRLMERPALARANRLLERYPTGFILAFRFIVGLRTISPIVIGTTRIATGKF